MVPIPGQMGDNMQETGVRIKCMGRAFLVGWMEGDMKVNMKMIKNMVRESLSGQMGVNMMDSGKLENKMELAGIMVSIIQVVKVNGQMGRELNGLMRSKLNNMNNDFLMFLIFTLNF